MLGRGILEYYSAVLRVRERYRVLWSGMECGGAVQSEKVTFRGGSAGEKMDSEGIINEASSLCPGTCKPEISASVIKLH